MLAQRTVAVIMDEADSERTTLFKGLRPQKSKVVRALMMRQEGASSRRVLLDEAGLSVGRGATNDLVLASPEVSRKHCSIDLDVNATILTDLSSTNGVYVDGQRIRGPTVLQPGAVIGIGPFSLTYHQGSQTDLAEAEVNERELTQAVGYIRALLPPPLREGPVRIEWRFVPSADIGGDVFGYRWLNPDRLSVFLLDVCGHGVSSALLAVSAANLLRTGGLSADLGDPAAVLAAMNAAFPMDENNGLFFSMWYGVYQAPTRTLLFASAGHHPAFLVHADLIQPLVTPALAIGVSTDEHYNAASTKVTADSQLHLFSDGTFEVIRADGTDACIDDLLALLTRTGPNEFDLNRVFDDLRQLTGHRPFEDDVSLLTLDFL